MRTKATRAALFSLLLCCAAGPRAAVAQDERDERVAPPAGWLRLLESDQKLTERERSAVARLRKIATAEATYSSTVGGGSYATLRQLASHGLLDDPELAAGERDGFAYTVRVSEAVRDQANGTVTRPADFEAKAAPLGPDACHSFHVGPPGIVYESCECEDEEPVRRPVVNEGGSIEENERLAVSSLRTLCAAEETFRATAGEGRYGTLKQLGEVSLIDPLLAEGVRHGYVFRLVLEGRAEDDAVAGGRAPAPDFKVFAIPLSYGASGRKSFYADSGCVIRAADRGGIEAGPDDEPFIP